MNPEVKTAVLNARTKVLRYNTCPRESSFRRSMSGSGSSNPKNHRHVGMGMDLWRGKMETIREQLEPCVFVIREHVTHVPEITFVMELQCPTTPSPSHHRVITIAVNITISCQREDYKHDAGRARRSGCR
jgi:hypothetical protein